MGVTKEDVGKQVKVKGQAGKPVLTAVFKPLGLAYVGVFSQDPSVPVPKRVLLKNVSLAPGGAYV